MARTRRDCPVALAEQPQPTAWQPSHKGVLGR